ncbi:MAG: ATP-dependent DNA helicase RecG [Kineosporiaceae bacterium]
MTSLRTDTPLAKVFGRKAAVTGLAKLGVETVGDLLRHYPRRYESWAELSPIHALTEGEEATIVAEVVSASARPMRARRGELLQVTVTDGTDHLALTFFNAGRLRHVLKPGRRALFSGTVERYRGTLQLTHPKVSFLDDDPVVEADPAADPADPAARPDPASAADSASDLLASPIPIYPAGAGVDSETIRRCVRHVLDTLAPLPDPLPAQVRAVRHLMPLDAALRAVHRPATKDEPYPARHRLRFEEAFVLQAALARRRADETRAPATPRRRVPGGLLDAFDERLPFTLTAGQARVGAELEVELAGEHPMHRLLQGEVGSGKTLVALRAMLAVVDAGGQAALLAPTEVLAAQHHRSITAMLGDLAEGGLLGGDDRGTRVRLLTGSQPTAVRRAAMLDAASGEAGIVVGTHALLSDKVEFFDLGLVVVDEQHRFGVEQRDALRGKGRTSPHLLVMTATPIPRTVAMTVFGDLETSVLDELPPGRSPIASHVVPVAEKPAWRERTWQRVREEVDGGHQVYVVCPRIGDDGGDAPSPTAGEGGGRRPAAAVLDVVEELRAHPALQGVRIETLHGRMPADDRDAVMAAFARGEVGVLVATTVIEVGVDVANATAMVVVDADRFGVSQLHQLRGRVGRGSHPGLCLLLSEAEVGTPARDRLEAVAATLDGFELARVDLEQRREGDVLGAAQSGGRSSLRLLRVLQHEEVIEEARAAAAEVVAEDPDLTGHPDLAAAIAQLLDPEREQFLDRG